MNSCQHVEHRLAHDHREGHFVDVEIFLPRGAFISNDIDQFLRREALILMEDGKADAASAIERVLVELRLEIVGVGNLERDLLGLAQLRGVVWVCKSLVDIDAVGGALQDYVVLLVHQIEEVGHTRIRHIHFICDRRIMLFEEIFVHELEEVEA